MRRRTALLGVLAIAASSVAPAAAALATSPPSLPHIKGAKYCGEVYKPGNYSLYAYVKDVGCATEQHFVQRCEIKAGLQGWTLSSSSRYGFLLRKAAATIELQIAGGSPGCIAAAID